MMMERSILKNIFKDLLGLTFDAKVINVKNEKFIEEFKKSVNTKSIEMII